MDLPKDFVFGNAAGVVKTPEDVMAMCRSAATRITVGSITAKPREGNGGDVYYYDEKTGASVNSLGMPNYGIEKYQELLPKMARAAELNDKELWASVAGFSPQEFALLTEAVLSCGVHGVELNLGCPNIHDDGKQHGIFSYEPKLVQEILARVAALHIPVTARPKISVKISPVPDEILEALSFEINESGIVTEVVACNTLPNQSLKKEDGSEALNFTAPGTTERKHTGGGAGTLVHEESLRVVKMLTYGWISPDIRVIFAGGVRSGATLKRCYEEDIAGVMCATALLGSGGKLNPRVLSDILQEYAEIPEPSLTTYLADKL